MAKTKMVKWTPEQTTKISTIPNDRKAAGKLYTLAEKWKIPFDKVRSKWYYEMKKSPAQEDMIVLVIDTKVTEPRRSSPTELLRLQKGIDAVVDQLLPRRGSIPVPSKHHTSVSKYLNDKYPKNKWVMSREKRDGQATGFSRIFKLA